MRFGVVGADAAAALILRNREMLLRRWGSALAEHPPPYRPDRPHRLWAGRDREAVDRILVVGEAPDRVLLHALSDAFPTGRVTFLPTGDRAGNVEDLLHHGIEISEPPADPEAWLRDRRFHYSAAVLAGEWAPRLRNALGDSQPQAEVLEGGAEGRAGRRSPGTGRHPGRTFRGGLTGVRYTTARCPSLPTRPVVGAR